MRKTIKSVEAECEAKLAFARQCYTEKCMETRQLRALCAAWEQDAKRAKLAIVQLRHALNAKHAGAAS